MIRVNLRGMGESKKLPTTIIQKLADNRRVSFSEAASILGRRGAQVRNSRRKKNSLTQASLDLSRKNFPLPTFEQHFAALSR